MIEPSDSLQKQPTGRSMRVSRTFVFGIVVVGVLLGFALGLLASGSLGTTGRSSSTLYDEGLVTSLFEKVSPAVVEIDVTGRNGRSGASGVGSGFLVDKEGHIVTNHHVVDGAEQITVKLQNGRTLEARRMGYSPADDLALLKVDADEVADIDPLRLADSDKVEAGQMAIAVGTPFRNFNSVTVGVVSGTGRGPVSVLRRPIPGMIQTDAPLNPGNSGGPLLNSKGRVIGVNSSVRSGTSLEVDEYRIGFAVPSNTLKDLLPELLIPQLVRRPWLGISSASVTRELVESLGVPQGIYIAGVFPDSPAEKAGLVPFRTLRGTGEGDVITAVDGRPMDSVAEMVSYFNTLKPGDDVTLTVFRNSQTVEVEVTLAKWPDT